MKRQETFGWRFRTGSCFATGCLAVWLPGHPLAAQATPATGIRGSPAPVAAEVGIRHDTGDGRLVITNGPLELTIETKAGLNPRSLRDVRTGAVFADRDYSWPGGVFPTLSGPPAIVREVDGGQTVRFKGRLGSLEIEQVFAAPGDEPGILVEQVTIRNAGAVPLPAGDFKCGFTKSIRRGDKWAADAGEVECCPVPYRRETNGRMQTFPLRELAERGTSYAGWMEPAHPTPIWGAEGWVWSKGQNAFLVAKYNPDSLEWSLIEPESRGQETLLRFGGAGQWKHGHPEAATRLEPGQACTFGETRIEVVHGDWKQAYYAYRRWLDGKGCRPAPTYDPPVHWNELYDNQYFFKVGEVLGDQKVWYTPGFDARNQELLAEFYSKDLMLAEAAKASELGCEALYLDPGWDTGPSHHRWGTSRLGSMASFVQTLRQQYGLEVSLWIGLGGVPPTYADPQSCPPEARVVSRDGQATPIHCFASPAFLETKEQRLLELCRQGVAFLMFDSTQFSGPCYDGTHGHSIPSTREEHVRALLELTRRVKAKFPEVLIEMHDPITGPSSIHYTPTYYGYGRPQSFDCLWGHEFMWGPMDDLLSRRAVSLYYYNLAYSIPLYLHVSLKTDNEHALVFWWFASTCRHLGVGGKPGPAVWEACKQAMRTYQPLKPFYARGAFYGIEETVHAHTLPERKESVMNVFNLEDQPVSKRLEFRPGDLGLPAGPVRIEGAEPQRNGDRVVVELPVPARGHRLLRVKAGSP